MEPQGSSDLEKPQRHVAPRGTMTTKSDEAMQALAKCIKPRGHSLWLRGMLG